MLGVLLGMLQVNLPHDFLDAQPIEDENEDTHWASETNLFEDWLLHGADAAAGNDPNVFY